MNYRTVLLTGRPTCAQEPPCARALLPAGSARLQEQNGQSRASRGAGWFWHGHHVDSLTEAALKPKAGKALQSSSQTGIQRAEGCARGGPGAGRSVATRRVNVLKIGNKERMTASPSMLFTSMCVSHSSVDGTSCICSLRSSSPSQNPARCHTRLSGADREGLPHVPTLSEHRHSGVRTICLQIKHHTKVRPFASISSENILAPLSRASDLIIITNPNFNSCSLHNICVEKRSTETQPLRTVSNAEAWLMNMHESPR